MKLTASEVNVLLDKCSYGGDYECIGRRLVQDQPKNLRLNLYEKDLISSWLLDQIDAGYELSPEEQSILNKLYDANGNYR